VANSSTLANSSKVAAEKVRRAESVKGPDIQADKLTFISPLTSTASLPAEACSSSFWPGPKRIGEADKNIARIGAETKARRTGCRDPKEKAPTRYKPTDRRTLAIAPAETTTGT